MFHFLKKLFEKKQIKFVIVTRKTNLKIKGGLYKIIFKDPPKDISFKSCYFTFWEKVVKDTKGVLIDLNKGIVDSYCGGGDIYTLVNHRVVDSSPDELLEGREYIMDDLGVVIPLKSVYIFEPCEEVFEEDVEVENTILIPMKEIEVGDVVVY